MIFRRTFAISLFALLPLSAGCGSSGDIGWNFRPPSGGTSHTSDKFRDTPRMANYISPEEWANVGIDRVLVSRDNLEPFKGDDDVKNSYATSFELLEI